MPHQFIIERDSDQCGWSIYLLGRDEPIGDIRPTPNERWHGKIDLDGRRASLTDNDAQFLVDLFQSFAAAGIPNQSELNAMSLYAARAWIAKLGS
jgi:hypothetical protein